MELVDEVNGGGVHEEFNLVEFFYIYYVGMLENDVGRRRRGRRSVSRVAQNPSPSDVAAQPRDQRRGRKPPGRVAVVGDQAVGAALFEFQIGLFIGFG